MANPATFLDLVQRTYRECGLVNNPPSSVAGQTGMAQKVVDWVLAAHAEIQESQDWKFDWTTTSKVLSANVDTYDPVGTWGLSVKRWCKQPLAAYVYRTADGLASRTWLWFMDWEDFRGLNVPQVSSSVPLYWTIRPDGQLVYMPAPSSGAYTVVHEYFRAAEEMAADATVPRMPKKYLMRIVWRAVQLYCGNDLNNDLYKYAEQHLRPLRDEMLTNETPPIGTPEALA